MGENIMAKWANQAKILGEKSWERFRDAVVPKVKVEAQKIVQDSKNDVAASVVKLVGLGLGGLAVYYMVSTWSGAPSAIRYSGAGSLDGYRILCRTYNEVHNSTYNYYKEVPNNG